MTDARTELLCQILIVLILAVVLVGTGQVLMALIVSCLGVPGTVVLAYIESTNNPSKD